MVPSEKTSLAFQEVAVIPKVGRWYALSVAPTADKFQHSLPECKWVPSLSMRCLDATASSWHVNFLARCNTHYKQSVVHDIILFAHYFFY